MSFPHNIYPYRFANQRDGAGFGNLDLVIHRLENETNNLKNEISNLKNENHCLKEDIKCLKNIHHDVVEYIKKHCSCNDIDLNRERILTGNGAPSDNMGIDGSFYLDNDTGNYYIKVAGRWILRGNLKGPQGTPGSRILTGRGAPNNALGNVGDFYLDNITKVYYTKVGSTDEDAVWVAQGSLDANTPINLVVPLSFSANVNIPSTSGNFEQLTNIALVANGNNTVVPIQGSIILPLNIYYPFIYYANTDIFLSQLTITVTNTQALTSPETIVFQFYETSIGQPLNQFNPNINAITFGYLTERTPAFTSRTIITPLIGGNGNVPMKVFAGTSIVLTLAAYEGIDGTLPFTVSVAIT